MKQRDKFYVHMNENKIITDEYHGQIVGRLTLTSERLVAFEHKLVTIKFKTLRGDV